MHVIGVTGMPGSGKSEAMAIATELGHPVIRMGDLIWEEVDRQGLERVSKNVGAVANEMRKIHGDDVWAIRTAERARSLEADTVLIDGIRSNAEVDVFRRELGDSFLLVAIHTEPDERYSRLTSRARDDDPTEDDAHKARDARELDWGLARTIAMADHMLVNDSTLASFQDKVRAFLLENA